jgi:alpha/beta superfamily hydrolase
LSRLREIAGPSGTLEAVLDEPAVDRGIGADGLVESGRASGLHAAVVLAHPHPQFGGTMHTKALFHAAKALTRIGCVVLRFNFRGVGLSKGTYDDGPGEQADVEAALGFLKAQYPNVPLWSGGMSFGAWAGMSVGAADSGVSALIGIATPVSRYDFEAVRSSTTAKFFIHGERDEIAPLKNIREFYARAADPKELAVIDAADHLFDGKVGDVADAVEDLLADWHG